MVPIETPLVFSGFHDNVLREFGPMFHQMGITAVQGGAAAALRDPKPAKDWQNALQPGDAIAGVLVSGDMSVTGLGTTTYNDGKRVLGFGHPFFNLGPVNMPMSKGEVLMVLSSQFQPNKFANATEIVGALKQDRHSGIMGELGATAEMIPVTVKVRSFGDGNSVRKEKDLKFNVFVQQKWTPYLMMVTLFNSVSGMNDFAEEATYRLTGEVELDGQPNISLATMLAPGEMPIPAPMLLAGWWGDKFNRLFGNAVKMPRLKSVNATIDLLPERRVATIENAWLPTPKCEAGTEVPVKVYLRPYRGERIEREIIVKIPAGLPKGEHRILLSDADTLNRTAERRRDGEPLHRSSGDRVAAQSGAQQQSTVRLAGADPPDLLRRRQDHAQSAGLRSERDAGEPCRQPPARQFGRKHIRAGFGPVRVRRQRQPVA